MHMPFGALEEEEAVVINELTATVEVQEGSYVFAGWIVDKLHIVSYGQCHSIIFRLSTHVARFEVEPGRVELVGARKVRHAHTEVPELVH